MEGKCLFPKPALLAVLNSGSGTANQQGDEVQPSTTTFSLPFDFSF